MHNTILRRKIIILDFIMLGRCRVAHEVNPDMFYPGVFFRTEYRSSLSRNRIP